MVIEKRVVFEKILLILFLLLLLPIYSYANLGNFDRGDFVNYDFQFLDRNATVETSVTNAFHEVLYPNNSLAQRKNLTQVSTSTGLFTGNFSIPNESPYGVYTVRANATVAGVNNTAMTVYFNIKNPFEQNKIYFVILSICLILFLIGQKSKDNIFTMVSGMTLVLMTIYQAKYGFYNFIDPFINQSFIIIFVGLGSYLILNSGYSMATEGW